MLVDVWLIACHDGCSHAVRRYAQSTNAEVVVSDKDRPGDDNDERDDDMLDDASGEDLFDDDPSGEDAFDKDAFDGDFDGDTFDGGESDDRFDDDLEFEGRFGEGPFDPLDEREAALVEQDLSDLADFEAAFAADGYRGMAVWCHDCSEEHYYPWDMLRENLTLLLQTGEAPVHEPAFNPEPSRYVPWDYARGYVDALRDAGLADRQPVGLCPRCTLDLSEIADANFCPRCGSPIIAARLAATLAAAGIDEETAAKILGSIGLPHPKA